MTDRRERLMTVLPRLRAATWRITSPPDRKYNCIAWSANDTRNWWWPVGDDPDLSWPDKIPHELTLDAFEAAFATLGYSKCLDEENEEGIEKVAIF